jgi:1-acyl-sn-glycerol-3-phosphate acyltransferase
VVYFVRYLLVASYTIFWGVIGVVLGLVDRSGRGVLWVGRNWIRWCLATCGVEVEARGLEGVPQPCVAMCNHQSVFDIAALVHTFPHPLWRFVAKRELLRIPFFGWALALANQIIIDRGDNEKAVRSLKRAAQRVRNGENVLIFPEGTRSSDAILHDFKSGGFHLAIESGVPIVPVTVSGSHRITPKRSLRIESGRVLIRYGKPIPTDSLDIEDRNDLKKRVREAILAGYDLELQPNGGLP